MNETIFAIENALMLGCSVTFQKDFGGYFSIQVTQHSAIKHVQLPLSDHLNDKKVSNYIKLLTAELIK